MTFIPFILARAALLAAACGLLPVLAQEAAPGQAPLTLSGDGPYHRLTLPPALHGRVWQGELDRLRIHNASGQAVPWAWLTREAAAPPRTVATAVPLYAWPAVAGGTGTVGGEGVPVFALGTDGRLRLLAPAAAGREAAPPAAGWLIDMAAVPGAWVQMRVELAPGVQGLFPFTLQASDDLQQWRTVGPEGQLLRLPAPGSPDAAPGPVLERLAVDLQGVRAARFLRLLWRDPARAPALQRVQVDSEAHAAAAVAAAPLWSGPIAPDACAEQHCDYPLPAGWPLTGLRVHLPQANTLSTLTVAGVRAPAPIPAQADGGPARLHNPLYALRRHAQRPPPAPRTVDEWPLFDAVVYRIDQPGGEARSGDLVMDGAVWPRLRLRTPGPIAALGAEPPTLEVASLPRTLVFLAQGEAPFELRWPEAGPGAAPGPAPASGAPLALATLMPGDATGPLLRAGDAQVVIAPRAAQLAAPDRVGEAEAARRQGWLWGALGVGLLVLGGMAGALLRGVGKR